MNRESETGRARVGPWEFAWHPAWWLALTCLAVAVLLPCQNSLDQRQTQLVLLGLPAIPLAAGAARAPGRR
ncbi:hypothetical protein ACWEQG_07720 [Microbispora sp. NPDC004025]